MQLSSDFVCYVLRQFYRNSIIAHSEDFYLRTPTTVMYDSISSVVDFYSDPVIVAYVVLWSRLSFCPVLTS